MAYNSAKLNDKSGQSLSNVGRRRGLFAGGLAAALGFVLIYQWVQLSGWAREKSRAEKQALHNLTMELQQQLHIELREESEVMRQTVRASLESLRTSLDKKVVDSLSMVHDNTAALKTLSTKLTEKLADMDRGERERLSLPKERCGRQQDEGRTGEVVWSPDPNKFLFAMCSDGLLSNRLFCLRHNILGAALLNRTLVFPTKELDYDYERLVDLDHITTCFGHNVLLPLSHFQTPQQKSKLRSLLGKENEEGKGRGTALPPFFTVNRMICHVHAHHKPAVCDKLVARYRALGVDFESVRISNWTTPGPFAKYSSEEFLSMWGTGSPAENERVIAFGNIFGGCCSDLPFIGSAPLAVNDECKYFLQPSRTIRKAAVRFVKTYLGGSFLGVHLRRGEFVTQCLARKKTDDAPPCFLPIAQAARCLTRHLRILQLILRSSRNETSSSQWPAKALPPVFLATDGNDREEALLTNIMRSELGTSFGIVRIHPKAVATEPWGLPLVEQNLHEDAMALELLDKTVCAMAKVFVGTYGSSFSTQVATLRNWWFMRSCADGHICDTSEPGETFALGDR